MMVLIGRTFFLTFAIRLANVTLPGIAKNLDKASVIRITISFLRMCKFADSGFSDWNMPFDSGQAHRPESAETTALRKQIALNTLKVSGVKSGCILFDKERRSSCVGGCTVYQFRVLFSQYVL